MYADETQLDKINIRTLFICPTTTNFVLQGNSYSDTYSYISVTLSRCVGGGCQTASDIDNALDGLYLDMAVVNTYFDFEDFQKPVKTYLDDRFYYKFAVGFSKIYDVFIQK